MFSGAGKARTCSDPGRDDAVCGGLLRDLQASCELAGGPAWRTAHPILKYNGADPMIHSIRLALPYAEHRFGPHPDPASIPTAGCGRRRGRPDERPVDEARVSDGSGQAREVLPPGFSLRGDPSYRSAGAWFKNLYWLAGRWLWHPVDRFSRYLSGQDERLDGALCPVIGKVARRHHNGREELGFSKMFAAFSEMDWDEGAGRSACDASWYDHKFFDIELTDLVEEEIRRSQLPGVEWRSRQMYYKYMPRRAPAGARVPTCLCHYSAAQAGSGGSGGQHQFASRVPPLDRRGVLNWHRATFEQFRCHFTWSTGWRISTSSNSPTRRWCISRGPVIGIAMNSHRAVEPA